MMIFWLLFWLNDDDMVEESRRGRVIERRDSLGGALTPVTGKQRLDEEEEDDSDGDDDDCDGDNDGCDGDYDDCDGDSDDCDGVYDDCDGE